MTGDSNPMKLEENKQKIRDAHDIMRMQGKAVHGKALQDKARASKQTPEYRAKMSELVRGEKNPMYGKRKGENPNSRKMLCVETGQVFDSVKEAAEWAGGDVRKAARTGKTAG